VDFTARAAALEDASLESLSGDWHDGRIKQMLIARTLALRGRWPDLFEKGTYEPVSARGALSDHVVAFARRYRDDVLIAVAPRCVFGMLANGGIAFDAATWRDTALVAGDGTFMNEFERRPLKPEAGTIALGECFGRLPVALLVRQNEPAGP
jgi:maltooligosyltrehalose synthase